MSEHQDFLARSPVGVAPARLPCSIRRTTSLDVDWPEGCGGVMHIAGRARDLFTRTNGTGTVLAEAEIDTLLSAKREIIGIDVSPPHPGARDLVGARAGGHLRKALAEAMPEQAASATPLNLLIDDLAGTSLVCVWAWSQSDPGWMKRERQRGDFPEMAGICTGFRPGSQALELNRAGEIQNYAIVPDLPDPTDPLSWHPLPRQSGTAHRRARMTDVWLDAQTIRIRCHFQDSATRPDGQRAAVHEYTVDATADRATRTLRTVDATPRVLPYKECTLAPMLLGPVIGASLTEMRNRVIALLPGPAGCTHLNDVLRSLADVPALVDALEAHRDA